VENFGNLPFWGNVLSLPFIWRILPRLIHMILQQTQVSAKFVMKTDDDAFVRVDEVLGSLHRINVDHGLLYGLINSDSRPHRNTDSKWYISPEVEIFLSFKN